MKSRSHATQSLGRARRFLALVSLALFGHAVALHLLHGHDRRREGFDPFARGRALDPARRADGETRSGEHCPACQLQHGFVFLDATPALVCLEGLASVGPELGKLSAARRIAEGSAPPARRRPSDRFAPPGCSSVRARMRARSEAWR
jgi:hypothetical protein